MGVRRYQGEGEANRSGFTTRQRSGRQLNRIQRPQRRLVAMTKTLRQDAAEIHDRCNPRHDLVEAILGVGR